MTILPRSFCVAASVAALFLPVPIVRAETVRLKSGELIEGTVQDFQENILSMAQPDGKIRKIVRDEIVQIEFQKPAPPLVTSPPPETFLDALPKTVSKFQTPRQTFLTWRKAATAGDIDSMADCYSAIRKNDVKKELKKLSRDQRDQMRQATATTEFTPAEPFYQGDRAVLEVTWRVGLQSDSQILQFTLEGKDWKIIQ
ncbi:MAG: hypothetical protein V1495_01840 [Pseudomonadota bacterium]